MKGLTNFQPDSYYHIVNHAVGSENLFRNAENYRYFLKRYAHYMPSVCNTLAYCLMPNHIHFLIKTHGEEMLIRHKKFKNDIHRLVMQQLSNLLNSYAKAYNKLYNRKGALWIDFTKRFPIESDSYLTSVINYIHQNPIKHGFASELNDWEFTSYRTIMTSKPTLLKRDAIIEWFGDRQKFLAFHIDNGVQLLEEWEC